MSQLENKWGSAILVESSTKPMKVRDLISKLQKVDPDMKVVAFAEGKLFPATVTQVWKQEGEEDVFEIGCGWTELPEDYFKIKTPK